MNDKTYKDVNGLEKDDLSLMYTLGEALGDLPTDDETQQAWAEFEAKHYRTNRRRKIVRLSIGVVAGNSRCAFRALEQAYGTSIRQRNLRRRRSSRRHCTYR